MDTIAAIVTAPGHGGLAVLRLSGSRALEIANACFRAARGTALTWDDDHRAVFGTAMAGGEALDQCMATLFRSPRSYTGEDTAELSCHGGVVVSGRILRSLLAAGARMAEPGEFTRRAYENGKLDLVQAEAVLDLVLAHGDQSAQLALNQLSGRLSSRIRGFRDSLIRVIAELQAELEFPDEDLTFERRDALGLQVSAESAALGELLATYDEGRQVRQGFTCVLAGAVNVGKSTLSNALLGQDRSIVTAFPGTTRDLIESRATVRGVPVTFVDTAGLRASPDPIEQEGIRRTRSSMDAADIVILVLDSTVGWSPEDERLLDLLGERGVPVIVAWNKTDLAKSQLPPDTATRELSRERTSASPLQWISRTIPVSAVTGAGLEALRDALASCLAPRSTGAGDRLLLSNERQHDALSKSKESLDRAGTAFAEGLGSELIVEDLRVALRELGRVLGETTPDDVLDDIFARFCIGK